MWYMAKQIATWYGVSVPEARQMSWRDWCRATMAISVESDAEKELERRQKANMPQTAGRRF
jgi:hypothetical protein